VGLGFNPSTGVDDGGTVVYSIDPVTGMLAVSGSAGNGMIAGRSMAIDPRGRFFFDGWGTTPGTIDSALISPADGTALTGISSVTLSNQAPAAMLAESSGKFLYVQQGAGAVVYSIDQLTAPYAVAPARSSSSVLIQQAQPQIHWGRLFIRCNKTAFTGF